jgi:hypothetical protein
MHWRAGVIALFALTFADCKLHPRTTVSGSVGCPDTTPLDATGCPTLGISCTYTTGGECSLTFVCAPPAADFCANFSSTMPGAWSNPTIHPSSCNGCAGGGGCVPCENANTGDACDVPGARCQSPEGGGGNCDSIILCQVDHTWSTSLLEPGCCF